MMQIYNTQTRRKEEFKPIEPGKVRIYCCGPTVYNYFHIGNARPFIVFDTLRRYLEHKGYEVKYVQNFTDIDDKMIRRANEEGITSEEVAKKYIAEYFTDAHALGVREATVHPKATENIQQIIDLITTLIDKGYAYEVNGDVYYRTLKFKDYGKLSHQPIEDLQSGARIDVSPKQLGYDVCCFIGIILKSAKDYPSALAKLESLEEVTEAYYTTGHYSIFIKVMCRSIDALQQVLINKIQTIDEIQSTETLISLQNPIMRTIRP